MHNQLRGAIRINASGRGLYRFINMIHSGRICCFKQYVKGEVFHAEIYRADLAKVQELAEKCNIELSFYEYETLSKRLLRYRKRLGISVGVLLALVISVYFSSVVVTIEIEGNTVVSDSVILSALEEIGIKQGAYLGDINFTYSENRLRLMVDGISWAGMRRTGNRIVVEVTEIVEKPEMTVERVPCNVVSQREAQIIGTSVYDGQLMRIVGDYVFPGDMLISGVIEDSKGHITKHHAMGEITGIYEETVCFTGEYKTKLIQPTGETDEEQYLKLLNLKIPLFIGKNSYASSVSEESSYRLSLFGKELPVSIITEKITETVYSEREYTEPELSELLMEKIFLYEKNFLSDVKILEREIEEEKKENSLTYTVRYTIEGEIGVQKEIFIK